MLYDVITNEWGEVTYIPTPMGKTFLVSMMVILLYGAVWCARRYALRQAAHKESETEMKKSLLTIKQLTFCAMAVALGTVLSNIKLFHFPTGGSITLFSMLIICLPGYFFGVGAGFLSGLAYGILQLIIDPYVLFPVQLVLDYFLAFGAFGLSGLFANAKAGLAKGYITGILGRYACTVLSGWIFFGSYAWEGWGALPYSIVYNAIYIFAEAAATLVILSVPAVRNGIGRIKAMALT